MNTNNHVTSRDSNLELLRIISMILIIMHHYSVHGNFSITSQIITSNVIFVQLLSLGGKLGVACFVLITGYFMITSSFKFKKMLKLILEVLFYSVGIMIIFYVSGTVSFDPTTFLSSILPITHSLYWFATTYVVLYILSPFINILLKSITQKIYLLLLLILFILASIVPTFLLGYLGIGNVGIFIFIYMTAAYIRMYPNSFQRIFSKCGLNYFLAVCCGGLLVLSVIAFDIIGQYISIFAEHATYFMALSSPIVIIGAIFLFLGFKNLKLHESKIINQIAISMFGVYLIHDNIFVRSLLWETIFQNASYLDSNILLLHAFAAIMVTFVLCVIIDQLRILLFEKPFFNLYDKLTESFDEKITRFKSKFEEFVHYIL